MEMLKNFFAFGNHENGNIVISFEQFFNVLAIERTKERFCNIILVDKDYELKIVNLGEEFNPEKLTSEEFQNMIEKGEKIKLEEFEEKVISLKLFKTETNNLKKVVGSVIKMMNNDEPSTESLFLSLGFNGKQLVQALTGKKDVTLYR